MAILILKVFEEKSHFWIGFSEELFHFSLAL